MWTEPKGRRVAVQLDACRVAVHPFDHRFLRRWESACNHGMVTCLACGGSPSLCFGSARMMCGSQPPCRSGRTLEDVSGDLARDAEGCKRGGLPIKRGIDPLGSGHAFVLPSCIAPFHLLSPQMGCSSAALLLLSLEERGLVEISTFQPLLGFKDFRRAARLHSLTNGQFGGEKQAGLWPPPRPQLQGSSSSLLRRRES
jgi:hypothetical protein